MMFITTGFKKESNALFNVVRGWIDRYFSNEEALLLLVLIGTLLLVVVSFGQVLAPFFTALIIAYLLQGAMQTCKRRGLSHLASTLLVFSLFACSLVGFLFFLLPAVWQQMSQFFYELPRMAKERQAVLLYVPERFL